MEDIRVRVWSEQNATSVHSFLFSASGKLLVRTWRWWIRFLFWCNSLKDWTSYPQSLLSKLYRTFELKRKLLLWKWSERENDGVDFISWSWPEAKESIGDPHGFDGAGGISRHALHFLYREQFASSPLVDSGVEVTEKSVSWNRAWPGWWKVSGRSWWDVHLWCSQSHWEAQVGDKLIVFQLDQKFYFDLSELQHLMNPSQEHVFKGHVNMRGDAWMMIYESLIGLRKVI